MTQELDLSLPDAPVKKIRKPRKPRDPNAPRKLSVMQQVVTKHVADMKGCYDPAFWKREAKLYASLSKKYGADFLLWVNPPEGRKFASLMFYMTVLGKNYLSDQLVEYAKLKQSPQETKEIQLAEAKIGEDVSTTTTKPRTLKEFLNYGKTLARQTSGQESSATDSHGADGDISGS